MSRTGRTLLLTTALALAAAAPAHAGIWTELPSGTSAEITAIEYQSDTRFWFTTSTGEIFKRKADLSGFDKVRTADAVRLNDIEFQAGGDIGFAVGNAGRVLRSQDGGATWANVNPVAGAATANPGNIPVSITGDGSNNQCRSEVYLEDVNFVRFAGAGRVWVGAAERQIATSQPADPAAVGAIGTWRDANRRVPDAPMPQNNCLLPTSGGWADMFVTANPDVFYLAGGAFDEVLFTANNLATTPQEQPAGSANGFLLSGTLAGDPANPSRMWAVSGAPYNLSTANYTEDAFQTSHWFKVLNESSHPVPNSAAWDVDYAGGTVLAAGNGGYIMHSVNGRDFFWNGADGALATQDWRAVGLAGATHGAVGGTNGKLVITSSANAVPDIVKPTGTIVGPTQVTAGQPAAFTLQAADEGGSGLNPASIAWSSAGLPSASGQTVNLTFPNAGFFTVRVAFADNAGNTGEATLSVNVRRGSGSGGGGGSLPVSFTGPGNTLSAKIVGRFIRVTMRGSIVPPTGATRAACRGKVTLRIKKGKRTMANRKAKLKLRRNACRFAKVVRLRRAKVGRTNALRLTVSHPGNTVLRKSARSLQLVIRK